MAYNGRPSRRVQSLQLSYGGRKQLVHQNKADGQGNQGNEEPWWYIGDADQGEGDEEDVHQENFRTAR